MERLASVSVARFALDFAAPLSTAAGEIGSREGFVVCATVEDDGRGPRNSDPVRGVGEATPLPGWTESLADCEAALDALDGEASPEAALDALDGTPAARHGVALALADARARRAGVPLSRHLGGDPVERVPVNATVGDGPPETTADEARERVERGFRTVKVKVGARSVDADADRLRAVRRAVPENVALRADANGAWTPRTARRAFAAFADPGVEYVEQPLPADDLAGHAALRGGPVGVALDEALAVHPAEAVLAEDAADVLVCKPMVLGGLDRARAVALAAREAGVEAVVTTTVDGALARAGAVHLAASLPDPPACGLATADRLASDLLATDPAPVDDGFAQVPRGPGLLGDRGTVRAKYRPDE